MRVEFQQGVPNGCVEWLTEHVGRGNISGNAVSADQAWFYERVPMYPPHHETVDPNNMHPRYVPTITVKDPTLATMFILRWA